MRRKQRAASLVELMVAVTILGLAMTLMVGLLPSSSLSLSQAEQRTQAGTVAQSLLDLQLNRPGVELVSSDLGASRLDDGTELQSRLDVTPLPKGAFRLKVSVIWKVRAIERSVFRERVVFPINL